jgi:CRISPR-associated endonuclease Cas1
MLYEAPSEPDHDSSEWADRSEFWIAEQAKCERKRPIRQRNSNPLILTGQGTSLRIDKGTLVVRQGFSHFPQKQECYRYFRGDLDLPRIIILLDGSGTLSFDVLSWLGEQGVALARIDWAGDLAVFASGAGFIADPENLRWQFSFRDNERARLDYAADLIRRKLGNCVDTLVSCFSPSRARENAVGKAERAIDRLKSERFDSMGAIRAIEGECALAYFSVWSNVEMRWVAQSRYPVPDQWRTFRARTSHLTGQKWRNWKASHPINAMLNYAYAVKAARLQIDAVADGYDPYAGIMHHVREGFPAYVYDLIEPERPNVDAAIIAFAQSRRFSGADFVLRKDGVCRLSPQLARMVAARVSGV